MNLTLYKVPARDAIRTTVALIKKMAWEGKREPEIKQFAVRILNRMGLKNGRNRKQSAILLTDWVGKNIQFWPDPEGTEMLQRAIRTIEFGYGDCDDMSILLGALLMAVGIPVRFRVVGFKRPSHIYVEGLVEGGWLGLDPAALDTDPHPQNLKTFILEGY